MPKATRPLEYVCLFPLPVPPEKKHDDLYGFMAVDVFSKFLFHLGVMTSKEFRFV